MELVREARNEAHYAALDGRVEDVRAALAAGADPSLADRSGFTPLHFAAQQGQPGAARLLVETGADIEARNKYGNTPLWVALMNVGNGDGEVVRVLLAAGASPDAVNASRVSPRDLAARVANFDVARLLADG